MINSKVDQLVSDLAAGEVKLQEIIKEKIRKLESGETKPTQHIHDPRHCWPVESCTVTEADMVKEDIAALKRSEEYLLGRAIVLSLGSGNVSSPTLTIVNEMTPEMVAARKKNETFSEEVSWRGYWKNKGELALFSKAKLPSGLEGPFYNQGIKWQLILRNEFRKASFLSFLLVKATIAKNNLMSYFTMSYLGRVASWLRIFPKL